MTLNGIWQLKKIAMRNLLRHKVKTILTSLAIMVSVAVYIFLNCWLGGTQIESRRNIVNFEIGAAKLQSKAYFAKKDEMPSYENFSGWEIYRDALYNEGYNSAPRFVFSGTLFSETGSAPILFHGVEPELERETMHYMKGENNRYVDFGRYVENNRLPEIVLGHLAAEKLKVGIPSRPFRKDLEELVERIAASNADAGFIRSLYEEAPLNKGFWDLEKTGITEGNERMLLKRNLSKQDKDRYWDLILASGRNNVRIQAMIDIKAVPETIRVNQWKADLLPKLPPQDIQLLESVYRYADDEDAYILLEEDTQKLEQALEVMIRADYAGAVRHVYQVLDVTVVGVINCPAPLPNANTAYIPLDVLQDEAGMMLEGAVTELVIRDRNIPMHQLPGKSESAAAITAALTRGLAAKGHVLPESLEIRTWDEYMADYLGYEQIQLGAPNIIVFLLLLLSFLGISNTILMSIMERTKETGMMRAMGMTGGQIKITYMLEAGFIGVIGTALGVIFGCLITYPLVEHGMDFSAIADTMSGDGSMGFRVVGEFRAAWDFSVIAGSAIVVPILASLIALMPTRKALKMRITDSLRFE